MCKRSTFLVSLVLVLGLAGTVSAELVGHWRFEGDFIDLTGNGHDGTPFGNPTIVADPVRGQVLQTNGTSRVRVADAADLNYEQNESFSYMLWASYDPGLVGSGWRTIFVKGRTQDGGGTTYNAEALYGFWISPDGNWHVSCGNVRSDTDPAQANEWHHLTAVQDGDADTVTFYIDSQAIPAGGGSAGPCVSPDWPLFIGAAGTDQGPFEAFGGRIDEAQIYNHALTEDEILSAMEGAGAGYPLARAPDPKDGAFHEDTWVTLSWSAGDFAVSHDVYLGDDLDVVDNATRDSDEFHGNQMTDFYVAGFPGFAYPEGLTPGTTYYWRIDEVNDADPNSPWKGDIWSFSIPPKTAYNPDPADGAGIAETTVTLSWTAGFGAKLHTIYFGDDFDTVANATVGMPVGTTSYNPGPLEAEKVYYWRVDEFDGLGTYKGYVWAFTTPGAVGSPQPANGATDVAMATVLGWTAADNATSHEVYLGLDKDTVRGADTSSLEYKGSKALGAESYDPGLFEPDTTYYWRVDEVYNGNPVKGPVWSFTVGAYLLVDDFESYTDEEAGEAIWQIWIDGFGVTDNGAQVGYLMPPYTEQTIVHGGAQSMPLLYVNEAGVTNSEGSLPLTVLRDWTTAGVGELSLWTRGSSANAVEPLYVAISNAAGTPAVVANDDPAAAMVGVWTEWRIPLQAFTDQGINLTNVDKIAVGLGSKSGLAAPGGTGTIYFDDIRLYRYEP
ncbi:LamG-like jellyroll fold domain-containing protein [Planctomycetota bacterium]